jgi:hypothetical protein
MPIIKKAPKKTAFKRMIAAPMSPKPTKSARKKRLKKSAAK